MTFSAPRDSRYSLLRRFGRGDHSHTQRFAQLHKRRAGAVAGVSHQRKLTGFDPCQIGISEVGDQQRRVMYARFDRAEHIGITGQRGARQDDRLAVHRIVVRAFRWKAGHFVADGQVVDISAHRSDHASHFMTEARRQTCLGRRQILAPQGVVPTDADCLDTHLHFARTWLSSRMLFAFEHLGRTKLVKTDRAGHRKPRQSNL